MSLRRFSRLALWLEELFPERHIYLRSGGEMHTYAVSTHRQMLIAGLVAATGLWLGVSTAATLVSVFTPSRGEQDAAKTAARYERWIADRDARLSSAIAQLNATGGSFQDLADTVEKRHAALAMLLTDLKGAPGAAQALAPALAAAPTSAEGSPVQRIEAVQQDQDRLIDAAETYAKSRADRLKLAFRLAGLDPAAYAGASEGLGGPLIEGKDPRALAAVLDVDEGFAGRLQHAVADISDMQGLAASEQDIPLARPTTNTRETSGFGVRSDPFSGEPAFHSGQDFAGVYGSPVEATAPGVVSFTGVRSGYGNTVEIDHGHSFKTRYAHLSAISVSIGQHVAVGQRIGAMGSTGRSTGTHLHYEVWVGGRPQNPLRFVKAGDYVQQTKF
jgi:murein DD-endopeptidase MepM/ murein hydrolase activator NlpD